MKKIMFTTLMLLVVLSVNGFAVTGSISWSTGLFATMDWANAETSLSWDVTELSGFQIRGASGVAEISDLSGDGFMDLVLITVLNLFC